MGAQLRGHFCLSTGASAGLPGAYSPVVTMLKNAPLGVPVKEVTYPGALAFEAG